MSFAPDGKKLLVVCHKHMFLVDIGDDSSLSVCASYPAVDAHGHSVLKAMLVGTEIITVSNGFGDASDGLEVIVSVCALNDLKEEQTVKLIFPITGEAPVSNCDVNLSVDHWVNDRRVILVSHK